MLFFNRPVYFAWWDIGALHAACTVSSTVDLAHNTYGHAQPLSRRLGPSSRSTHERQKEQLQHKTISVLSPLKLFVYVYVFTDICTGGPCFVNHL